DVIKYSRLNEEAALANAATAADELGALLLTQVYVAEDLIQLLLGDLWALFGAGVERVAELAFPGQVSQALDKVTMDFGFDEEAAAAGATLAPVEKDRVKSARHGGIQVGIGEDHVRALAAQLKGGPFQGVGGGFLDGLGRVHMAREGDLVHAGMRDQR